MKKHLFNVLLIIVVSLCTFFIFSHFGVTPEIAIVDTQVLLTKYKGTKKAVDELESKTQIWKNNLDTLTVEFQNRLKEFEKERLGMSNNELKLAQELLRNKQSQLEQYQSIVQQKIQEEDQKVSAEVFQKVNQAVSDYAEHNGYDIILGAKGDGGVLYGDKGIDITDELIQILNNGTE